MDYKKYGIALLIAGVSFALGMYASPKSVQLKETDHTEVSKNQNVNKNQDVVETTTETRKPDGTVVIEKRKENQTSVQTQTQTRSEETKSLEKTIESRPSYRFGAMYEPAIKGFQETAYAGLVEKRVFSELYLGVSASSRRTVGLTISLGF